MCPRTLAIVCHSVVVTAELAKPRLARQCRKGNDESLSSSPETFALETVRNSKLDVTQKFTRKIPAEELLVRRFREHLAT